jgi:hypothetical protein
LLPGVTDVNAPTTVTNERNGGPTYSVSGSRNTQNLMLFDGLMWNNLFYNTGISYPPHEALQEISVLLNNYTAQYGRNSGSIFNVLTRSGTNTFHGTAWDYVHNTNLDATDYFVKPFYPHPLEDRQNQVGFTVGGPIKREKAYFFVAVQDLFAHKQAIGSVNPFSENMLGFENDGVTPYPCNSAGPFAGKQCGDFNQYMNTAENPALGVSGGSVIKMTIPDQSTTGGADEMINNGYWQAGNGNGGTIPSPCIQDLANASSYESGKYVAPTKGGAPVLGLANFPSGTAMPYSQIPVECFNPAMIRVINQYVPPGIPNGTTSSGGVNYSATRLAPLPQQDLNLLARVDYNLNSKHTLDARYDMISANDHTAPGVNNAAVGVPTYESSLQPGLQQVRRHRRHLGRHAEIC